MVGVSIVFQDRRFQPLTHSSVSNYNQQLHLVGLSVPLDQPGKVRIEKPLVGDEATIEKTLFGKRMSGEGIEMNERFALDAKIKKAMASAMTRLS